MSDWWVNFEAMLRQEQLDRIGLSRSRGVDLCITRLCAALNFAEEQAGINPTDDTPQYELERRFKSGSVSR